MQFDQQNRLGVLAKLLTDAYGEDIKPWLDETLANTQGNAWDQSDQWETDNPEAAARMQGIQDAAPGFISRATGGLTARFDDDLVGLVAGEENAQKWRDTRSQNEKDYPVSGALTEIGGGLGSYGALSKGVQAVMPGKAPLGTLDKILMGSSYGGAYGLGATLDKSQQERDQAQAVGMTLGAGAEALGPAITKGPQAYRSAKNFVGEKVDSLVDRLTPQRQNVPPKPSVNKQGTPVQVDNSSLTPRQQAIESRIDEIDMQADPKTFYSAMDQQGFDDPLMFARAVAEGRARLPGFNAVDDVNVGMQPPTPNPNAIQLSQPEIDVIQRLGGPGNPSGLQGPKKDVLDHIVPPVKKSINDVGGTLGQAPSTLGPPIQQGLDDVAQSVKGNAVLSDVLKGVKDDLTNPSVAATGAAMAGTAGAYNYKQFMDEVERRRFEEPPTAKSKEIDAFFNEYTQDSEKMDILMEAIWRYNNQVEDKGYNTPTFDPDVTARPVGEGSFSQLLDSLYEGKTNLKEIKQQALEIEMERARK